MQAGGANSKADTGMRHEYSRPRYITIGSLRYVRRFPLIHASAEQAPFADVGFDLAISEYGVSIWCDP